MKAIAGWVRAGLERWRCRRRAKLVEIEDSYTLIPEDQPERLARELREFVKA